MQTLDPVPRVAIRNAQFRGNEILLQSTREQAEEKFVRSQNRGVTFRAREGEAGLLDRDQAAQVFGQTLGIVKPTREQQRVFVKTDGVHPTDRLAHDNVDILAGRLMEEHQPTSTQAEFIRNPKLQGQFHSGESLMSHRPGQSDQFSVVSGQNNAPRTRARYVHIPMDDNIVGLRDGMDEHYRGIFEAFMPSDTMDDAMVENHFRQLVPLSERHIHFPIHNQTGGPVRTIHQEDQILGRPHEPLGERMSKALDRAREQRVANVDQPETFRAVPNNQPEGVRIARDIHTIGGRLEQ